MRPSGGGEHWPTHYVFLDVMRVYHLRRTTLSMLTTAENYFLCHAGGAYCRSLCTHWGLASPKPPMVVYLAALQLWAASGPVCAVPLLRSAAAPFTTPRSGRAEGQEDHRSRRSRRPGVPPLHPHPGPAGVARQPHGVREGEEGQGVAPPPEVRQPQQPPRRSAGDGAGWSAGGRSSVKPNLAEGRRAEHT